MKNTEITLVEASHTELRTKELNEKASRSGNEAHRISIGRKLTEFTILLASGMLTSTAFPSLNWSMVIWLGLVPMLMIVGNKTVWQAWRAGFIWGYGFSICAFFWLREIEFFIPFAMAAVLALFPAFWALLIPVFKRKLLIPVEIRLRGFDEMKKYNDQGIGKELLFAMSLAAWWCILEWVRSWIGTGLPWNYLATSQWRNLPLIQICEFTGVYGVSFLIAMVNITLALAAESYMKSLRNGKLRRPVAFSLALVLILTAVMAGPISTMSYQIAEGDGLVFSLAAIQGDISQRRQADEAAALEALDKYLELSAEAVKLKPDLIVWPETAVPYPFRSRHPVCYRYRTELARLISNSQIPFLIGSIDFENMPENAGREPGVYNSALFIDASLTVKAQFNKAHIVPFGEFVPFRRFLPEWIIRAIDMGRDLTPGDNFEPIEVIPGVRAGINICFEDVFAYVAREEARLGANMLL
ncbi:MAG: apolipoprotein N-acyltransferase, partial [Victivallales bacterium]|nr:apolipoprotein N-acyltransferase [Victivallales bacterium]